jgi:hypothetical protein
MKFVRHRELIRVSDVKLQLFTLFPLTDPQAKRLALHLWMADPRIRAAKGKVLPTRWVGTPDALELLAARLPGGA